MGASGVVVSGAGKGKTVIRATGKTKRAIFDVSGGTVWPVDETRAEVVDGYVPVGAVRFRVKDGRGLKVGDGVMVVRVGNAAWISEIGMDRIPGRPGRETVQWEPFEMAFDRVVTAVEGDVVTVDAPIMCAIDERWGGGYVVKVRDDRIENLGVEGMSAVSDYDATVVKENSGQKYAADEEHAEYLVSVGAAKDVWVRDVETRHFAHGPVRVGRSAKWVTVAGCDAWEPVSQLTGARRYTYHLMGQLTLVRDCTSEKARHAFVFGSKVCGPNVFLRCKSAGDYNSSEPHHRWSVGGLYDNVEAPLAIQDRAHLGTGHGWAGANYVVWNSRGSLILQSPPTARNWAIGFVGEVKPGAFEGRPEGTWESLGRRVEPESIYEAQVRER
jgi:hypothetical protein